MRMVLQFILKGLFFYFLFLFVRSFFRGATQVKGMKEDAFQNNTQSDNGYRQAGQKSKSEDIVEADFRRL